MSNRRHSEGTLPLH